MQHWQVPGNMPFLIACTLLVCCRCSVLRASDTLTTPRTIRTITLDIRDVFDPAHDDWFFAGGLANAFHSITNEYLVEDELLFEEGDDLDTVALLETERNLRRAGVFSYVRVAYTPVGNDEADVTVYTRDRWSLRPAILAGTGGGISNLGGKIEEINLAGTATQAVVQGMYRTENDIGWEGLAMVSQRRLFRSEVALTASLRANAVRTDQYLGLVKSYRTMSTPWAFGLNGWNAFGQDFAYMRGAPSQLLPFHERIYSGWISQASGVRDRLFISASLRIDDVHRTLEASRQAFDNTGQFLIAFSSIRQTYSRTQFLNGYEIEDVQQGAWGSAVLGRVFSLGNGGRTMWYFGGQAEQSGYVGPETYLFGHISAATGIAEGRAGNTYLETGGIGHHRLSQHFLLASRFRIQSAWNWSAFRQLVLDFESGVRGYRANSFAGDNRFTMNSEVRWFPGWRVWIAGVSAVAFHDYGTVWNQGTSILDTRMHHAVGVGLRFHNLVASGDDAVFRFDFAYNLDDHKVAGVIFTTQQYFSAFGNHTYKVPEVFGRDIDLQ